MTKSKALEGAAKRGYDVAVVIEEKPQPLNLTPRDRKKIVDAFGGKAPSDKFFGNYEAAIGYCIVHATKVSLAAPAKVATRVRRSQVKAFALLSELKQLETTDMLILDREATFASRIGKPGASVGKLYGELEAFVRQTGWALDDLSAIPKGGRMDAYAEQVLATSIDEAINQESGSFSSLHRGGQFAKLLRTALDIVDEKLGRKIGKPRSDVMALMKYAKSMRC